MVLKPVQMHLYHNVLVVPPESRVERLAFGHESLPSVAWPGVVDMWARLVLKPPTAASSSLAVQGKEGGLIMRPVLSTHIEVEVWAEK